MRKLLVPALLSLAACASSKEATREELPASASSDARPSTQGGTRAQEGSSRMAYPATRSDAVVDTLHGQQVADPYRWLEDEKSPEVQAWMKAQDGFARSAIDAMPGRDALAKRFKDLFYVDSVSAPARRGQRYFFMRTHKDKEKAIVYWREGESGQEKVLLDPNGWSKDGTVSLGTWAPSWDGKRVAFAQKPNAADEAVLHVMDVASGEWSKVDVIEGAKYATPHWTPDGKGFYYEWLPTDASIPVDARPGYTTLKFHVLGQDPKSDVVVHERTGDPTTFLQGDLSRDGRYLFASVLRGWSENDVYWKHPADKDWRLLVKGKGAKYNVIPWKDRFYVVTDEGAPRQRVFAVDPKKSERANWKELVPEDPKASLESVSLVGGHLALEYLKDATTELRITTLEGQPVRTVTLPGVGAASNLMGLEDQDDAYFAFSSFTTPRQVYRTSVATGKVDLWAKVEVPMDPDAYTTEQVFFPSKDGTRVPMFLVYKKGLKKDGNAPTLLYGYGGFFVNMQPTFRSSILPWLDAGGIYAVANLRGGGEYGTAWHDAGKGANKQNVFDDMAGAAEFLAKEKFTQAKKLAIYGGSNGGLLVGAAMTQRPELYGAVVCGVPLLDMVRYHLFGSGRTWVPEYGSAEDPAQFKTLYAYSPYHHVRQDVKYPALLMMSSDHDDRVDPMHARKFVAAVQNAKGNSSPTLLRIEANAGHGGADQVAKAIESSADMYAFLFQVLDVARPVGEVATEGR